MDDVSINFTELVALSRITAESTVEKFGSLINSSFFDASNILATLKQKGLVDFVTAFPSQSLLKLTEKGTDLLSDVKARSTEPIDQLDLAILTNLSNGKRGLGDLATSLNVAQRDLAIHIYKLSAQQNLTYELVNANVSMYLTEKGFVAAKNVVQPAQAAAPQVAGVTQEEATANGKPPVGTEDEIKLLEKMARRRRLERKIIIAGVAVIIIIIVVVVLLKFKYNVKI